MSETEVTTTPEIEPEAADQAAPAPPRLVLPSPSPAAAELIEAVLRPEFAGVLEVGGFKLQMGFLAMETVAERFGSYEGMGERITKAGEAGEPTEILLVMVEAAEACLRGALRRHHPDHSEDDLEAVYEGFGDATSVVLVANVLMNWWKDRDGIGSYVVGLDPTVVLGERTYTLKWGLRAVRHVSQVFRGADFGELQARHYREALRAMLLRFHGDLVGSPKNEHLAATLLDDLGLHVGLGGIRRLMAGAEQPRRPQQAGPEAPSPAESGTGLVS